jgi:hypothetical protein
VRRSISVPAATGPLAAGLVLDNYSPNLLWYLGALLCAVSATGFYAFHARLGAQPRFAPAEVRATVRNTARLEAERG